MTDWIKAMNPAGAIDTKEAALAAARLSAVGMVLGAVRDSVGAWYSANGGAEASQRAIENLTGQVQSPEQVAQAAQFGLMAAGVVIVLQLILAVVQWLKPNQVLPIIFLALVVLALGGTLLSLTGSSMPGMASLAPPMWTTVTTLVLMTAAFFMHIAGIRGASALSKFRDAQAY
ncbi:hypothetical protein [Brevundimonas sp.]|uniref:hypothetical protein n=1 Tax=Brevundimonas sp. TaxID=1871086 RepID=UPI002ED86AA1